jgi:hypothetical protein
MSKRLTLAFVWAAGFVLAALPTLLNTQPSYTVRAAYQSQGVHITWAGEYSTACVYKIGDSPQLLDCVSNNLPPELFIPRGGIDSAYQLYVNDLVRVQFFGNDEFISAVGSADTRVRQLTFFPLSAR